MDRQGFGHNEMSAATVPPPGVLRQPATRLLFEVMVFEWQANDASRTCGNVVQVNKRGTRLRIGLAPLLLCTVCGRQGQGSRRDLVRGGAHTVPGRDATDGVLANSRDVAVNTSRRFRQRSRPENGPFSKKAAVP